MSKGVKHIVTPATRQIVEALAGFGADHDYIAREVGVSARSIERLYKLELANGVKKANAAVARTCYQMAVSGNNPAATFFWLKTRARWRETDRLDVHHKITGNVDLNLHTATDTEIADELATLDRREEAAAQARAVATKVPPRPDGVVH